MQLVEANEGVPGAAQHERSEWCAADTDLELARDRHFKCAKSGKPTLRGRGLAAAHRKKKEETGVPDQRCTVTRYALHAAPHPGHANRYPGPHESRRVEHAHQDGLASAIFVGARRGDASGEIWQNEPTQCVAVGFVFPDWLCSPWKKANL